jgi:hypothetical protein
MMHPCDDCGQPTNYGPECRSCHERNQCRTWRREFVRETARSGIPVQPVRCQRPSSPDLQDETLEHILDQLD